LWRSTLTPDISAIATALQDHYQNQNLSVSELHTGLNVSRRGIMVCDGEKIAIAFLGTDPNELHMNLWTDAKGPAWWDLPYPVYENGNRVHSFFRDMWHGMRLATYDALSSAVEDMHLPAVQRRRKSSSLGIQWAAGSACKHDVRGKNAAIDDLRNRIAFTDILEKIRHTWGSQSASPQSWAQDEELGSLVQHLTFAAVAAGDYGYYTVLNQLYEIYQIRAWDFLHHRDMTVHIHHFQFRSWRGYRYILPDAVVRPFDGEFSRNCHGILGYLKVAEWMAENGTNQVKSPYNY
jgi:hypothetical protein